MIETSAIPPSTSTSNLNLTLRAWPVIALATIGLCFLTQTVAKWFGVELPDQENIDIVRRCAGWNLTFALLVLQVIAIMPALEECIFRWLFVMLPQRLLDKRRATRDANRPGTEDRATSHSAIRLFNYSTVLISSALFSAAHYLSQPWPDAAFLALFFFGLAQCWIYRKTERLWCPILNHALFNLTNLVLLFIVPE